MLHIFERPHAHLLDFERLCAGLRAAFNAAAVACGVCMSYSGACGRFCDRFCEDVSKEATRLRCVALYTRLCEVVQAGAHYAVLQEIDAYLEE